MTTSLDSLGPDIPLFTECVIGYRMWRVDKRDRLWPMGDRREPWQPGINTARCNRPVPNAAAFSIYWQDGRRIREAHPVHAAPDGQCTCGLYSWRRDERSARRHNPHIRTANWVWGAVASWGRIEVHATGFRAEHSCVVALGYLTGTPPEPMDKLRRVADRYRVELVPVDRLQAVAGQFGRPLPDTLSPGPPISPRTAIPAPVRRPPDRVLPAERMLGDRLSGALSVLGFLALVTSSYLLTARVDALTVGIALAAVALELTVDVLSEVRRPGTERHIHFSTDKEALERL